MVALSPSKGLRKYYGCRSGETLCAIISKAHLVLDVNLPLFIDYSTETQMKHKPRAREVGAESAVSKCIFTNFF